MKTLSPKFYSIVLFGLMGLSALLFLLFVLDVIGVSWMINWCYLLFGIALLAAVVFPIAGMAKDFKSAKNSLMGIGILIVIYIIGFVVSDGESYSIGDRVVEGTVSKHSEAGLITFYAMIAMAIGTIIYTEISKAFK